MITTEFHEEHKYVLLQIGAEASPADVLSSYAEMIDAPAFKQGMHAIWDISQYRLAALPLSEFRKIPTGLRQHMRKRGRGYRTALVTRRTTDYQLLRIYSAMLRILDNGSDVRVFSELQKAKAWIDSQKLQTIVEL